jgi:hypothetical protein
MKNLQTYEEFLNESQSLIFDEIGTDITNLQDKIDELLKKDISAPKWIVALKGIQSACKKVEDMIAKADQKLGAIPYNESAINEGVWADMMKGVKTGDNGPWSIVALEYGKVVGQSNDIKIRDLIPAKYEDMKRKYPKAKFHIEDAGGTTVWRTK